MSRIKRLPWPGLAMALALFVAAPLALCPGRSSAAPEGKQKGISFAAYGPGAYTTPDADRALEELAETGADWIALIVTRYQDTHQSRAIYAAPQTPPDEDLAYVIDRAHRLGLRVMLKPHLDLARDPTHWRGEIGLGFEDPEWAAWFASYASFINHYALLAQIYGADQLCIGTELNLTEAREADWRAVVAGVRARYAGPITYAINHDRDGALDWWDAVDLIGIDAYYPLTPKADPTPEELEAAWAPQVAALRALSARWGRPVLLAEVGYTSADGAAARPWAPAPSGVVDTQEQADLYEALFQAFWSEPWFAGVYWWAWETDPLQGGPCHLGFTPHDKPAEDVLRRWYGAPRKVACTQTIPGLNEARTSEAYTDRPGAGWISASWGGAYNFSSTARVARGSYAIAAETRAWGALVLHHSRFNPSPYYWLELWVYKTSEAPLRVWLIEEGNRALPGRPVEDCRYSEGQRAAPGEWTRLRIPLRDLGASGRALQGIVIGNWSDQPAAFHVDEVRLAGPLWPALLPLLVGPPS